MIKHKPTPKTNVNIDGIIYICNDLGIVELPRAYKQFNPIEEEVIIKDKKKQEKKEHGRED